MNRTKEIVEHLLTEFSNVETCEDKDPDCSACGGHCLSPSDTTVFRVDMEDNTGTPMCDKCASDAFESGLFTTK